jgi:hypothetical protein
MSELESSCQCFRIKYYRILNPLQFIDSIIDFKTILSALEFENIDYTTFKLLVN